MFYSVSYYGAAFLNLMWENTMVPILLKSPLFEQIVVESNQKKWKPMHNKVKNPYWGKSMLTCGSVKETLK
jgi:hypothetical protein